MSIAVDLIPSHNPDKKDLKPSQRAFALTTKASIMSRIALHIAFHIAIAVSFIESQIPDKNVLSPSKAPVKNPIIVDTIPLK